MPSPQVAHLKLRSMVPSRGSLRPAVFCFVQDHDVRPATVFEATRAACSRGSGRRSEGARAVGLTGWALPSSNVSGYSTLHTEIAFISSGDKIPNWIVRGRLIGLETRGWSAVVGGRSASARGGTKRCAESERRGQGRGEGRTESSEQTRVPTWRPCTPS